MRSVTLAELRDLAAASKQNIFIKAQSVGRYPVIYLHWTAGHYGQFFEDYHISIDFDGNVYVTDDDLSLTKQHTYHRNTGAIGISLACCYQATTEDLGPEPPTELQIEALAQVIAVLCDALVLPVDIQHVMTHAEAADNKDGNWENHDAYGPELGTCERWDLWFFLDVGKGNGGDVLRGKAKFYQENGV